MLGEQTRWGAGSRTEESRVLGEQNCEKLKKGNSEGMVDHLAHRGVGGGHPSRPDPGERLGQLAAVAAIKTCQETNTPQINKKKNRCGLLGAESLLPPMDPLPRSQCLARTHGGADPALSVRHGPRGGRRAAEGSEVEGISLKHHGRDGQEVVGFLMLERLCDQNIVARRSLIIAEGRKASLTLIEGRSLNEKRYDGNK
jgi:hypothetical protein